MVDLPLRIGPTFTVRKVERRTDTPAGEEFFLLSVNTNGIDSRWIGMVPAKDIKAKVICVFK
jgi:type IV secretory pathway protease TraF